jgi:hypothetical protein
MAAAVIELQREAMDRGVPLSDLLRKAFVIARKLGLEDFQQWIQREMNGYEDGEGLPPYRMVNGQVRGWNPYHGWIPVLWESAQEEKWASRRAVGQGVAELEELIESRQPDSQLHMPLPHKVQRSLSRGAGFNTNYSLFVQHTSIVKILDAVRNTLLNWALKLEEDGILGNELTFDDQEKQAASGSGYNVNNFFGSVGSANVQQAGDEAVYLSLQLDLSALREVLGQIDQAELKLPEEAANEFKAEIKTIEAQLDSPKPKHGVIREAAESARSILEAAGGGVATHLALEFGRVLMGG